ncbi:MAG: arsenate reductase ArsC [Nitrospiraceae bacterium]|nr:arsenate reductase ArsC [Nitrospiraceae bacterium]
MKKIAFLCTGNSCRSQMAEGFAALMGRGHVKAFSAGVIAAGVNANAVAVMKEIGIDIASQWSKTIEDIPLEEMDMVVTLCDNARQSCPAVPAERRVVHISVKDPAGTPGDPETVLKEFRRARDEIGLIVARLLDGGNPAEPTEKY